MSYGTGTKSEFDDVRHGYAPPREHNRPVPAPQPETRPEDVDFGFVDAPYQQSGDPPGPVDQARISDSVTGLFDSGKAVYEAEIALFKARADVIASATKRAAIFISVAGSAGLVAFLALGYGAIQLLSLYMTPLVATGLTALALGTLTALSAWLAKQQFDRITGAIWERTDA